MSLKPEDANKLGREPSQSPGSDQARDPHPAQAPRTTGVQGPGKKTTIDEAIDRARDARNSKGPVGDAHIDGGAKCDVDERGNGCFLAPAIRTRLVSGFQMRVIEAHNRYQAAANKLELLKLLEKDDDIHWALQLVFDFASSFIGGKITQALIGLRSSGIAVLEELTGSAGAAGQYHGSAWYEAGLRAIQATTDDHLKAGVGTAIKHVGAMANGKIKALQSQPQRDKKSESTAFLGLLRKQAELAYQKIRESLPAVASDAELITLWNSFSLEHHSQDAYEEELAGKLARFEASAVTEVKRGFDDERALDAYNSRRHDNPEDVYSRDGWRGGRHDPGTYVIWHVYVSGYPKELAFEHGGADSADSVRTGGQHGVHSEQGHKPEDKHLYVPREFWDVATARHAAVWGAAPATRVVDDREWYWDPKRAEAARRNWDAQHAQTQQQVHHPPGVKR